MPNIRFHWKGKELVIPETKAFEAGDAVEQIVTLSDFHLWGQRVKWFTVARAFGALARMAGAKVTDSEVHAEIMATLQRQGAAIQKGEQVEGESMFAIAAVQALQAVLLQAIPEDLPKSKGDDAGKAKAASSEPAS